MSRLEIWDDPSPEALGASAPEMLQRLGPARGVHVRGEDPSRTRAVVTLLHGNEPSGVRAMHAWLRRRTRPRVSCLWVLGAVEAALEPPGFVHRHLAGRRDLNRCFRPPFVDDEGGLARAILGLLAEIRPEAVFDLHNNTGHNPPYGIATRADPIHLGLTSWFGNRFVRSDLSLGALVEATEHGAPSVTIECGRAGDPDADVVALRGVEAFLASEELVPSPRRVVDVYEQPIRVTIRDGTSLAIADAPRPDVGLTLATDVDRHNWREVAPGTTLGWVSAGGDGPPVEARLAGGEDVTADLFSLDGGRLRARRPIIPIMITDDVEIAASDCLFYVVRHAAA